MVNADEFDIDAKGSVLEAARDRLRLERQAALADLRSVLEIEAGRRFLWRELSDAGVFRSPFHGEPSRDAFESGRRAFGLRLLGDILTNFPSAFITMQQEAQE